ncbi:MAG: hypothetical protein IPK82_34130 [Polyangiaceae bacterium]|nr:hypothetical protein [Polyangiaceae bacterium]
MSQRPKLKVRRERLGASDLTSGLRHTRRAWLLGSGAVSAWILFPELVLAAGEEKPFVGTYKHSGGDKEREARDTAIDDVVSSMNIVSRTIAREKLKSANVIAAVVVFASDDTSLTVSLDQRVYTAPLSGSSVKVTGITGDKLDLSYAVTSGKIEQRFSAQGKGRTNTFTKSGDVLTMNVRVFSDQLPKELKYKLTYKKA